MKHGDQRGGHENSAEARYVDAAHHGGQTPEDQRDQHPQHEAAQREPRSAAQLFDAAHSRSSEVEEPG
jgi:hypothetical protein